jgi:uncharacterized protein YecE (DUF72 family)
MATSKYHLGCTEWSQKGWKGNFFTDDAKQSEFLQQYSTVFNTVEGNTTFYHIPKKETIKKWGEQASERFKFCFKFHRSITHQKQLEQAGDDILHFLNRFEPLTSRLGPFMIQLPPQFSLQQFNQLENTLALLPASFSYAVEVRHPDFFDQGKNEKHLNSLLESYNIDRVIFDTRKLHAMQTDEVSIKEAQRKKPKIPARFTATANQPMVRFVGSNSPDENESYLKEWAIITADWMKEGLQPYIFIHAPDRVSQPAIARRFHQLLAGLIEIKPMPAWPVERQDEQLGLF